MCFRRVVCFIGLVGLTILGTANAAIATPTRGVNDQPYFSWDTSNPPMADVAERAKGATGPGSVYRISIDWREVQGTQGPFNWNTYDEVFEALVDADLRPLPVLVSAPGWARNSLCFSGVCPPATNKYWAWGAFVQAATARYADPTSPHFVDPVAIELWNEPNKLGAWNTLTGPDPAYYADVFATGHAAVNAVRSDIPIGVAGLAGVGSDQLFGDKTVPTFLNGFYNRLGTGVLGADDGIGIHPYPGSSEISSFSPSGPFRIVLDQAQDIIDLRDPGRPLWVTEVGYHSGIVGDNDQACGIVNVVNELEALDATADYDIPFVLVHSVLDGVQAGESYGLVRKQAGLPVKPSYCYLAADSGQTPTPCVPPPTPPTC